MILDRTLFFADNLAVTASADLTSKPDLQAINRDIGRATRLFKVMIVTETFLSAGATTLDLTLTTDDNTALSSDTDIIKFTSAPIPKASLVQGFTLVRALPSATYERYLGMRADVATGPFTAGKISVFITDRPEQWRSYNDPL